MVDPEIKEYPVAHVVCAVVDVHAVAPVPQATQETPLLKYPLLHVLAIIVGPQVLAPVPPQEIHAPLYKKNPVLQVAATLAAVQVAAPYGHATQAEPTNE
jgi:hypothetical protein